MSQRLYSSRFLFQLVIFSSVYVSSFLIVPAQGGEINCSIPSVKLSESSFLSCYFPEDVSQTRRDFTVYRYNNTRTKDAVLDCWWLRGKLDCYVAPGYKYNNTISDSLSLEIPQVSTSQTGTYTCQLANYIPDSINTCRIMLDKTSSCHVPSVKENDPTTFTCVFSVELNVTRQDVKVIRQSYTGTIVVSCTWINEKPFCTVAPGFEVNTAVTDRLLIKVPRATPDLNGTYVCHLQGSQSENFQSCDFIVMTEPHYNLSATVAVGIIIPLLVVIAAILIVLWRRGKITCKQPPFLQMFFKKQKEECSEEAQTMIKEDETTKKLLTLLSDEFRRMYPDFETKSFFVPPLYFNRNTHTKENIGGQHVYITKPPKEKTAKYDVAMARVLDSLRLLTEQEKKEEHNVMFIISQFNYNDYLAAPERDLIDLELPMPAGLREQDEHFGDFDILIVHRHHGALVGVVKACGDDPGETNDTMIVEDMKKGCEQLNNAEYMLNYLIPSEQSKFYIHKLLILPNVSQNRLGRVLQGYGDMRKDLDECLGILKSSDLHKECLCAEYLTGIDKIKKLKNLLSRRWMRSKDGKPLSVDQYVTILSRFCGPSTRWSLKIPGGPQNAVLSTAFKHSVSMTGDFFRAPVLQSEQWDVLNEERLQVFLTGPPASGKTRMLMLAGIRWMSEGQPVHVVSSCGESLAATQMIHEELSTVLREKQLPGKVYQVFFDKEDIKERVKQMTEKAVDGFLYVIADETESCENQGNFNDFVASLRRKVPRLHLLAASCFSNKTRKSCQTHALTCPPSILLQADLTKAVSECGVAAWSSDSKTTAPTEGPPVEFVYHSDNGHKGDHPGVCGKCATEVKRFLRTLPICKQADCSQGSDSLSHLHYKDVLILFESTTNPIDTPLCTTLADENIRVTVLGKNHPFQSAIDAKNDEVLVAEGTHVSGIKTKVVIYVEETKPKDFNKKSVSWKRLRGLTSATSQLIWVKQKQKCVE